MNEVTANRQRSYENNKDNIDRIVMAAIGGAFLGCSLYTNIGAIIGGLLGAIAGAARNDEIAKNNEIKRLRDNVNE